MSSVRRLAILRVAIVAASVLASSTLLGAVSASVALGDTLDSGETAGAVAAEIGLINADRVSAGLVAYQTDPRLMAIAAERAATMASTGLFSHEGPNGTTAFTMIEAAGITWYGAGEVIAWNTWPPLSDSATAANDAWMASGVHRDLLLSTDDNYVGVGVATSGDGTRYWSAVVMKGPDRTAPWAKAGRPSVTRLSSGVLVRLTWTGGDVPLQLLTSGLRDFQLQRRIDGGAWSGVTSSTTLRAWTFRVVPGHRYEFRVRARDRAGNLGAWTPAVGVNA